MIQLDSGFLAASQRSDFDKFRDLLCLIFSCFPASKMTLIGPVGDASDKLKTRNHICQWLAQMEAGDVFTAAWFLLLSSRFTTRGAWLKYLQNGNNLYVVALNVHACSQSPSVWRRHVDAGDGWCSLYCWGGERGFCRFEHKSRNFIAALHLIEARKGHFI